VYVIRLIIICHYVWKHSRYIIYYILQEYILCAGVPRGNALFIFKRYLNIVVTSARFSRINNASSAKICRSAVENWKIFAIGTRKVSAIEARSYLPLSYRVCTCPSTSVRPTNILYTRYPTRRPYLKPTVVI